MDKNLFNAAKKLDNIINSLDESNPIFDGLTDVHSQILKVGKYLDENKFVNKTTRTISNFEQLKSYTHTVVIYQYEDGNSLVEDTSGELYYIPTSIIE